MGSGGGRGGGAGGVPPKGAAIQPLHLLGPVALREHCDSCAFALSPTCSPYLPCASPIAFVVPLSPIHVLLPFRLRPHVPPLSPMCSPDRLRITYAQCGAALREHRVACACPVVTVNGRPSPAWTRVGPGGAWLTTFMRTPYGKALTRSWHPHAVGCEGMLREHSLVCAQFGRLLACAHRRMLACAHARTYSGAVCAENESMRAIDFGIVTDLTL